MTPFQTRYTTDKILELQRVRDYALRSVEKAFVEGKPELFDRAAEIFDSSTVIKKELTAIRDRDEPVTLSLGHLVGQASFTRHVAEEAGIMPAEEVRG